MVEMHLPVRRRLALLAALVLAQAVVSAAPAVAGGGTQVYLVPNGSHNDLWIKDAVGVANDLTVFEGKIVDNSARLVAGEGCVNEDPHTVNCPGHGGANADIYLGGKNDRITLGGRIASYRIYGERGNDVIRTRSAHGYAYGGPGEDVIEIGSGSSNGYGGPGNDWLDGSRGYSVFLWGDEGNDVLYGGPAGRLFGGADNDWLDGGGPQGADICDGGAGVNARENCRN